MHWLGSFGNYWDLFFFFFFLMDDSDFLTSFVSGLRQAGSSGNLPTDTCVRRPPRLDFL